MRNSQRIGNVVLGPGIPAICVPVTAADPIALAAEAGAIGHGVADIVELRIDFLAALDGFAADPVRAVDSVRAAVAAVRDAIPPSAALLFTFRNTVEGGQRTLAPADLETIVTAAMNTGSVDAVDVEQFSPARDRLVDLVHDAGIPVVMSSHDFTGTPPAAEIIDRLAEQQSFGADVVKIACMPTGPDDVLAVLSATARYTARANARPAVTMSMGALGVVSRLAGETFGSAMTFGTVGAASAPGQVDAAELRRTLALVHGRAH